VEDHVQALARHGVPIDVVLYDSSQGMALGQTTVRAVDVELTGSNDLVHSPVKLAHALVGLLA
jgi:hypothetical protein